MVESTNGRNPCYLLVIINVGNPCDVMSCEERTTSGLYIAYDLGYTFAAITITMRCYNVS